MGGTWKLDFADGQSDCRRAPARSGHTKPSGNRIRKRTMCARICSRDVLDSAQSRQTDHSRMVEAKSALGSRKSVASAVVWCGRDWAVRQPQAGTCKSHNAVVTAEFSHRHGDLPHVRTIPDSVASCNSCVCGDRCARGLCDLSKTCCAMKCGSLRNTMRLGQPDRSIKSAEYAGFAEQFERSKQVHALSFARDAQPQCRENIADFDLLLCCE